MDFNANYDMFLSEEHELLRKTVRDFAEKEVGPHIREWDRSGAAAEGPETRPHIRPLLQKMGALGFLGICIPAKYGGAGMDYMALAVVCEELERIDSALRVVLSVHTGLNSLSLLQWGSEEQKQKYLPEILEGEVSWCQGYSEPGAGSDLAALQTRAIRDGDDFVVNGQKIWTSGGHRAKWMILLARTDPDAPKHRGISMLLMDMKSPGVTVRPLINLADGHMFNEVFFEDVRVPARNVLGEINRGWYIGTTTLDFERSSIGNAVGQRQSLEYYMKFWKENQGKAATGSASAKAKDEFTDRWIEAAVAKMLSYVVITIQGQGRVPNHEASIAKLFNTELSQRIARTAMKMTGTNGLLLGRDAPMRGRAPQSYMQTVSSTIAGGTSEVQRNIVATRGLGLPRA